MLRTVSPVQPASGDKSPILLPEISRTLSEEKSPIPPREVMFLPFKGRCVISSSISGSISASVSTS